MGGGYWKSLDFKLAKDERNPLRILGRDIEKAYDATEQFGHLPNGFWATGLFDKQGKVQASAPDFIASDHRSNSNDKRVHVNAACIRCHDNGGLQDIDGWARNLFQPPLKLQSVDYYKERELRQQYFRDLKALLERDRKIFAEAVKDATGMEVKAYAKAYAQEWERYEDARVDLAWVANDLATTPEMLKKAVERDIKMQGQASDTVLSVFILEGLRQRSISIRQWEEVYPIAQMVISGYIQTQVQP
jgi:cytochrome c553